jgi:hypothetical protein
MAVSDLVGQQVKGRTAGWQTSQDDDYTESFEKGTDDPPYFTETEEWQEGELQQLTVNPGKDTERVKFLVNGITVDEDSIEELGAPEEEPAAPAEEE